MDYFEKIRYEFTAFIETVIYNSAIDYKRKFAKSIKNEISVADFISLPNELFSYEDSSFLLEKDIQYSNIENFFSNEKYYAIAKELSDKEKLVFYLTEIEEKTAAEVAKIMNTTENNIYKITSRARQKAINSLKNII